MICGSPLVLIRIRLFPFDADPDLDSDMASFKHVGKSAMQVRSHMRHQFQYFGPYIKILWEKCCLALHLFGWNGYHTTLVKVTDPRLLIRIHAKMSRIWNTATNYADRNGSTHGWRKKGIIHRGRGAYLHCPFSTSVQFSLRNEGSTEYICVRGEITRDNMYRCQSVCPVVLNDFDFF